MGLKGRFFTVLCIVGVISILIISGASYLLAIKNAKEEARRKVELLFYYQKACLDYFREVQAPLVTELVEKDRFYPELMSEFAASRLIHEKFEAYLPGFKVKYASLNPLNKKNLADPRERELIQSLSGEGAGQRLQGFFTENGHKFYFWAQGLVVKKGCLRCHGDPVNAPKDQVEVYGSSHGYGWKVGDMAGAFFVYLPMDEIFRDATMLGLQVFGVGAIMLLFLIVSIGVFLNSAVVRPILKLSAQAEQISMGESLDEKVVYERDDEIGMLAKAINRLRISVVKMQKMLQG